ncbi:MAG: hypothetical protein HW390_28 [Candidatus Brocadiaceae bacterium]|nr:hypothetical protein [Candidatus Brocadiaceae bacterium]
MPITKELENLRKFESVGFTHEQSEVLTDVIEQSHVNGQQSLKDFISDKLEELRKDVRNEITSSELRIRASHTDLLVKILAIAAGCTTIGIAISRVWK